MNPNRRTFTVALSPEERAEIDATAAMYGLSSSGLARTVLLGAIRHGQTEMLLRKYEPLLTRRTKKAKAKKARSK